MAEERLIDDDKDRKYRIRKNADGEDELYIVEGEEEVEEEPVLEVSFDGEDDEDATLLSPEQFAERQRLREQEEAEKRRKLQFCLSEAEQKLELSDFEGALYSITQGEQIDSENGELYALKLRAVSHELCDFSAIDACLEAADGVLRYTSKERKEELTKKREKLKNTIAEREEEIAELAKENSGKRAERRVVFRAQRDKWVKIFLCTALPFLVALVLAISFSTIMASSPDGKFVIITAVCAALAVLAFIATLITAKGLWKAQRNLSFNERDDSTKLGREIIEKRNLLDKLSRIYASMNAKL